MLTCHVLIRVLIAGGLTALIGAALAQDAPPAPRSVRVVYPGPFGDNASNPVRKPPPATQLPTGAAAPTSYSSASATAEQSVPASPSAAQAPTAAVPPPSPTDQVEAPLPSAGPDRNLVDINTASVDELNGLGGRFGKAIIAGRPYQSIDELVSRRILTRATFGQIRDQITAR